MKFKKNAGINLCQKCKYVLIKNITNNARGIHSDD